MNEIYAIHSFPGALAEQLSTVMGHICTCEIPYYPTVYSVVLRDLKECFCVEN